MLRIARILFLDYLSDQGVLARPEWTPWKPFVHETVPATVCCSHRFLSTTTHKQFDCREKRVRLLAFTEFSRHMGTGIPMNGYVDGDNWIPVEPESINEALWEVGCAKE